jgi:DNA-binding transcriptional ArsR family regulator
MNKSVLPVFRSDSLLAVMDAVLRAVKPISTSDVIHSTGLSQPLAHRELRRLTDAGVLREDRVGRSALFEADESNPAVSHLRALTAIALGPQNQLSAALRGVAGIERALIFGSFAARTAGIAGTSPNDIDLLIIGSPDRREVYDAIDGIDGAVRREVNVTFLRPERWQSESEELVRRVKANPVLDLVLT